jgi:flagellar hook-length control protein FliK
MNDLSAILPTFAAPLLVQQEATPASFQSLFDAASTAVTQPALETEPSIGEASTVPENVHTGLKPKCEFAGNMRLPAPSVRHRPFPGESTPLSPPDLPSESAEQSTEIVSVLPSDPTPLPTGSPTQQLVPETPVIIDAVRSAEPSEPTELANPSEPTNHQNTAIPFSATVVAPSSSGQQAKGSEIVSQSPDRGRNPVELFAKSPTKLVSRTTAPNNVAVDRSPAADLVPADKFPQILPSFFQPMAQVGSPAAAPDVAATQMPQLNLIEDTAWIDTLARDIAASSAGDGKLSFRLMPEFLGTLDISLTRNADSVDIQMQAATELAARLISAEQPRLIEELRQTGTRTGDFQMATGQQGNSPRQQHPSSASSPTPQQLTKQPATTRNGRFA